MQMSRQQGFSFWVCLGLIGLILLDLWPSQGNAIAFWQSEIFLELRLPRVLSALIGGIALGWIIHFILWQCRELCLGLVVRLFKAVVAEIWVVRVAVD